MTLSERAKDTRTELVVQVEEEARKDDVDDDIVGGDTALRVDVLLAGLGAVLDGVVPGPLDGRKLCAGHDNESPQRLSPALSRFSMLQSLQLLHWVKEMF